MSTLARHHELLQWNFYSIKDDECVPFVTATCEPYFQSLSQVRLALQIKNVDYSIRVVSLDKWEHLDPDYVQLNKNGTVPTLKQNNTVICESDEPKEGWYLWGNELDTWFDQRRTVKVNLHTFAGSWLIYGQCHVESVEGCCN